MSVQHTGLAAGKWEKMSLCEQMANIGSEVNRAIIWKTKKKEYSVKAIERALELIELTVSDIKNRKRLKEITRTREALLDYFYFNNEYSSSDKLWENYFLAYNYAARKNK